VLAALLDAQLDKREEIQARRARIVAAYRAGLSDWAAAGGVRLPPELPGRVGNDHIFFLLFPEPAGRDACLAGLRARGVMAAFHYVPLHSAPQGRSLGAAQDLPVTERVAARLLRLPLHPGLVPQDLERVIAAVRQAGGEGA
jgi:dTDP-4-amino-4,6-dideoxygalactose transaminase